MVGRCLLQVMVWDGMVRFRWWLWHWARGVETRLKVIRRTHSSSWAVCLHFCTFADYLTNPSSAKHFSCLTQRVDWGNWLPSHLTTLSHGLCSGCNVVILSALQVSMILRTMDRKGRVRQRKRMNFRKICKRPLKAQNLQIWIENYPPAPQEVFWKFIRFGTLTRPKEEVWYIDINLFARISF